MTPAAARALLGLADDAGPDEVHGARRRLAKQAHPDVGGDDATMRQLNEAVAVVMADAASARTEAETEVGVEAEPPIGPDVRPVGGVAHDVASFTIEALPAEAFEALLVVTSWIGEIVTDDPPYQLDVVLDEPLACWCRLDLVPDAGASIVSLTVATAAGVPRPALDEVRDVWVAALNELGA